MRSQVSAPILVLSAAACLSAAIVGAQQAATPDSAESFAAPLTPWGDPDLQGVWDYRTITPMQRPREFGDRAFYTEEEIAALEGNAARRMEEPPDEHTPANLVHALYMTDPGRYVDASRRTSLIVHPPDGRVPPVTAEAVAQQAAARAMPRTGGGADSYVDRTLMERCITQGFPRSIMPTLYNNNIKIVQAPGVVAIIHEMIHETRIVPLDGSSFSGVPSYIGESRGHWDVEDTHILARLIDDLRTLSLAESGALHLHREPTDLSVLAGETAASFRTQAEAAGVEFNVNIAEDIPLLEIDPMRIREVLANLIANALHYTPASGTVQVTGQLEADDQRVTISVSDTGSGIPPEALPHIFDRFYKSGNSRGTGLGLAIARNLVNAHGGEISAQSDGVPGHGTTIRFTLPLNSEL
jgi:two-component sensor histidine kinase